MNPMLLALARMLGIDANTLAHFQNLIATYNANQEEILAVVRRLEGALDDIKRQLPALGGAIPIVASTRPGAGDDVHPSG